MYDLGQIVKRHLKYYMAEKMNVGSPNVSLAAEDGGVERTYRQQGILIQIIELSYVH